MSCIAVIKCVGEFAFWVSFGCHLVWGVSTKPSPLQYFHLLPIPPLQTESTTHWKLNEPLLKFVEWELRYDILKMIIHVKDGLRASEKMHCCHMEIGQH